MITLKDFPNYNAFKILGPNLVSLDYIELAFVYKYRNYTCFQFMDSTNGKLKSSIYLQIPVTGMSRSMPSVDYGKLTQSIDAFLSNTRNFEKINIKDISPSRSIYDIDAIFFVKKPSIAISSEINLRLDKYSNSETPFFSVCISSPSETFLFFIMKLDYDFRDILKYFSNKELLASAARYRLDLDKARQKYQKKIRDLERKIEDIKNEMAEGIDKYDCDEIDNRLYECFDKDTISSLRLFRMLKEQ